MPIRPLSKELQEIAEKELNEVPNRVESDLDHIREWISQQPHLKARTDDQWLIAFLRVSKFSLQTAKDKIDLFYTMRSLTPEYYKNRDPFSPELQEILRQGVGSPLPKTTNSAGPRIIITRMCRLDPKKISLIDYVRYALMLLEVMLLEDDNFVVAGICAIYDFKNFAYSYVPQVTPHFGKQVISLFLNAFPMRIKLGDGCNVPSPLVVIYNMLKILTTEKFRSRVVVHTDDVIKSTNHKLPVSLLPKDYGGEEVSCDEIAAYWKEKIESYRDWFLEDAQYGVDESKRPGKPNIVEPNFGTEGSFRKLQID